MKNYIFVFVLSFVAFAQAQVKYETFRSIKMDQSRDLKIQLPRNYEKNEDKMYPIIVVLDADYLFEPVAGNVDYFSYWEDMPEAIVVGVLQNKTRQEDGRYDQASYLPEGKGADFYEFIAQELLPYINDSYRTAQMRMIIGHDYTSNFINYFLFKEDPIFQAYINLSPELAPTMDERITNALTSINKDIWYYVATATEDTGAINKQLTELDTQLQTIENPTLNYGFDNFEGSSHYTLVARAIPRAFEFIFAKYRPISKKIYQEEILPLETSPYEFLTDLYDMVEELYGVKRQIRMNDFMAIATAIQKKELWEDMEPLGRLAIKEHPQSMLGYYFLGFGYEQLGEPRKALKAYESGFSLDEAVFLTKDYMLDKVNKIKEDFGY
ncbi:alpha/beta hydrolase-fold protein [Aquimarina sp. ERC-38]|uniref:alpha/beta hydrolase n=1 Tax=Aquimarina sp. ERC-38 TaxID=2949996 RepID=UPI002245CE48|nr:alpha/beta hydrolase-fold protein [Aquimarina sp. ERC-38]UZO82156.1 alpha/beta hydrolase-fold protein [Aquimarina sp. ERC-38]